MALFFVLVQTVCVLVACDCERVSVAFPSACFEYPPEVAFLQRYLVDTLLVLRETSAVSAQVVYTPYNHVSVNSVTSCKTA